MVLANCETFQPVLGPHLYNGVTLSSKMKSGKFLKMQQLLHITISAVLKPRDQMLPAGPEMRKRIPDLFLPSSELLPWRGAHLLTISLRSAASAESRLTGQPVHSQAGVDHDAAWTPLTFSAGCCPENQLSVARSPERSQPPPAGRALFRPRLLGLRLCSTPLHGRGLS